MANATGKWQLPVNREGVAPHHPAFKLDQVHPGQNWLLNALSQRSSRPGIAAPMLRWTGQAHATRQLSCVPVTPFCHWDASAANSGANYLLAMVPLRVHHLTHDGEETSPYSYLITTWIAHISMFRPCRSARLHFLAVDSPASLNSSISTKDLIAHRIWGDGEKKGREYFFCIDNIWYHCYFITIKVFFLLFF